MIVALHASRLFALYRPAMPIREQFSTLLRGESLSSDEAEAFVEDLLSGLLDESQMGAALALIQARGASVEELVGGARAMRRHATMVDTDGLTGTVIDTCGTGGARKTFNISTLSAIVTASAAARMVKGRVRVAKHGNRGRSGRGSAELLAAIGVEISAGPAVQRRCLEELGVCFCFAVAHHPAMKNAAKTRISLGFPTIFNLLGPLTNPAGARRQVLGVYEPRWVERVGSALAALGCERAMVVHSVTGHDGIDEITTTGPTLIGHVEGGALRVEEFDPTPLGLARPELSALDAVDLPDAVRLAWSVVEGREGAALDIVLLNSAAALVVGGAARTMAEGLAMAREGVARGDAKRTLEGLIAITREA
jgi:anthranilate phosphoribosyltransferase